MATTLTEVWIEEQERNYVPRYPIEAPDGNVLFYGPLDLLAQGAADYRTLTGGRLPDLFRLPRHTWPA